MRSFFESLTMVFRKREYFFYFMFSAIIVLFMMSFPQNFSLIKAVFSSDNFGLTQKVFSVPAILYSEIFDFGAIKVISSLSLAMIFGINISFIIYYFKIYKASLVSVASAISAGAFFSGIIGLGCVSCGSLAIALLSSFFSISGLLVLLPFNGLEFTILSFVLILISTAIISKKISEARI